jgi:hypothetical protein
MRFFSQDGYSFFWMMDRVFFGRWMGSSGQGIWFSADDGFFLEGLDQGFSDFRFFVGWDFSATAYRN